jgi:hypothetical protein
VAEQGRSFWFAAELKALRIAAEIGGIVGLAWGIYGWVASGSLLTAVNPLLPIFGAVALVVAAVAGVAGLLVLKGIERVEAATFVAGPLAFVLLGMSVSRLGILVLGCCLLWVAGAFVNLVRRSMG